MSEQEKSKPKKELSERVELALSLFIRAFLRFILIILVIVCLGLAFYFGFPFLYQQYILPVQTNTTRLQEVQTQQAADTLSFKTRADELQARLVILEDQHTQDKETLSDLQSRVNTAESLLNSHTTTLQRLDQLQAAIDTLKQQIAQTQADTTSLGNELHGSGSPLLSMQWEVQVLKSMELLNRARLFLIEANAGLARQDVLAARATLASQKDIAPSNQQAGLTSLLSRLDLVLSSLPASPVTAADDLEIAWRQMEAGLSNNPDTNFNTETGGLPPAETATPTPTPGETSTPTGTLSPTSTAAPTQTPSVLSAAAGTPTLTPTP